MTGTEQGEEGLDKARYWGRAEIFLIGIAIVLRIVEYARNKAIWLDEAHLALSILRRDYAGLTERLDYGQGAPLLFLWVERMAVDALGAGAYAMRLAPVLASIVSCVAVYALLSRFLSRHATLFSFAVFALSSPVIRYASEIKAYASDLLVAALLYLLLIPRGAIPMGVLRAVLLAVCGGLAVWCAFPAIFVLLGIGAVLFTAALFARDAKKTVVWGMIGMAWVASFAFNYQFMLRHNAENAEVRAWWVDRFMPLPPMSASDCAWFIRTFFEVFSEPVGLPAVGVGALLFVLGVHALWKRDRMLFACVIFPIGTTLVASGLQRYPFMGRFLLFLVPLLLIPIGAGWDVIREALGQSTAKRAYLAIFLFIAFAQPVTGVVRGIAKPPSDGVRPAFEYLANNWREGDRLYLYAWAVAPFQYYEIAYGRDFPEIAGVSSRGDWGYYTEELEPLMGAPRVWVVLTDTPAQLAGDEPKFFVTYLDTRGQLLSSQAFAESSVYLYNLQGAKIE